LFLPPHTFLVRGTNINTVVLTSVISPTYISGSTTSSSPHVVAIAGGVAGGVVGLSLIALLFWFCVRKLRRDDSNRVIVTSPTRDPTLLHLDMEEVSPYIYDSHDGVAPRNHPDTTEMPVPQHLAYDMVERSDEQSGILRPLPGSATPDRSGFSQNSPFPDTLDDLRRPSRSESNALGNVPLDKEGLGEAAIERRWSNRANEGYDRMHASGRAGDVIQHQDGGRVPFDYIHDEPQREIPPSYDSIGPDRDPHH
jgi:hypothetical protein